MKIMVLNGSPKGKQSVTLQYVNFIQKKFPDHEFEIEDISKQIKGIEREEKNFSRIIDKIKQADAVIWAVPLYVFLVPSQYKRFIELIFERNCAGAFKGKYTAVITTSIHFYDHTAHNYMRAICEDLQMKYADYFSAHMYDLFKKKNQKKLIAFADDLFKSVENRLPVNILFPPVRKSGFQYKPGEVKIRISTKGKKVLVLTDNSNPGSNLYKMVSRFKECFTDEIEEVNIFDIDIKGGCLGCLQCGYDNRCLYTGKDEYNEFFESKVKAAHIIVYAGEIKDRFLSARWKMFIDRSFYNNHTPVLTDKQFIYIISGPLSQIPDIRQIFEAWSQIQNGNLIDFISDEYGNSSGIDGIIEATAAKAIRYSENKIVREKTFLGVGGMKIFRDDIYGPLRFPFFADYRAYKKLGIFSFPHRRLKYRVRNFIFALLAKIPKIREEIYRKEMIPGMVNPLKKIVEKE